MTLKSAPSGPPDRWWTRLAKLPGRLWSMSREIANALTEQVDRLVAMGRRTEAVALLERNLHLDGWRGKLRRRLLELGGRPMRAVH